MSEDIKEQITTMVESQSWDALGIILMRLADIKDQRKQDAIPDLQDRLLRMLRKLPLTFGIICNRMRKRDPNDIRAALDALVADGKIIRTEWRHRMNGHTQFAYGPRLDTKHVSVGDDT